MGRIVPEMWLLIRFVLLIGIEWLLLRQPDKDPVCVGSEPVEQKYGPALSSLMFSELSLFSRLDLFEWVLLHHKS